jgi:chemotaxis protein MotB
MSRESDNSGEMVYPRLPVQKQQRASEPRVKGFKDSGGGGKGKWIAALVAATAIGGTAGYLVKGDKSDDLAKTQTELATAQKAATSEKTRADGLDEQVAALTKTKEAAAKQLKELSTKTAEVDKKAAALAAEEKKIQATIDGSQGSVSTEGDEIHLKLVDKVLFAVGDDQLTDKGKAVLDKVAAALKDLSDKQVFVQGHTDDQPIFLPPPKKDPKAKPLPKGKEAAPAPVRFITNWELSSARALQVVHYLQDVGKIDPTRLAALAFGQYRPVSKSNKALNRRIEIVLYPKKAILEKAPPAVTTP